MLVLLKAGLAVAWPPVIRPSYSITEMANSLISSQGQGDKERKTQPYYTPFSLQKRAPWSKRLLVRLRFTKLVTFPFSRKLKGHHRTHNSSRLVLILNWINPVNIPTLYWFKIRFNIILQCKNRSSEWYVTFLSAFPTKILAHILRTKTMD